MTEVLKNHTTCWHTHTLTNNVVCIPPSPKGAGDNKYHTNQRFRPPATCPSLNYAHYQGILPSVNKKLKKKVKKKVKKINKKVEKKVVKKRLGKAKMKKVGQN